MSVFAIISLELEAFKSYRKKTKIEFSAASGLKFITGQNDKDPRLGANGIGKSTIWDAVVWALYGIDTQGDRASEIVSTDLKKCSVTLTFSVGDLEYVLERQGNPNKLVLNGEKADQPEIDAIVRLSYKQFCQCVIFGQGSDLFFDLTPPERGALLDEVFDLEIWNLASKKADSVARGLEQNIVEISQEMARVSGAIDELPDYAALKKRHDEFNATQQQTIDARIEDVTRLEHQITLRERDIAKHKGTLAALDDESALTAKVNRLRDEVQNLRLQRARAVDKHDDAVRDASFYEENETCPTCGQPIDADFCDNKLKTLDETIEENDALITDIGAKTEKLNMELRNAEDQIRTAQNGRAELRSTLNLLERANDQDAREIERIEQEIERFGKQENPYADQLADLKHRAKQLEDKRAELEQARDKKEAGREKAAFWKDHFKKVRFFLLTRTLDVLTLETASEAAALGLVDWRIEFVTETETKSGTRRQGIQILVYEPGASKPRRIWSGGEAQRVRLAVSAGFASMIERVAGISSHVEAWDEPTAGLSQEGIEDLLDCLKYRAEVNDKSIYLVDHHSLSYAGFSETWWIRKTSEGSEIEQRSFPQ